MKKSKRGSAIVIWMILTIIMSLSALVILSYMVPFARDSRWIENSTNAYYQAYAWIEESMLFIKTRESLLSETWSTFSLNNPIDYEYNTISSWLMIPPKWWWNSYFDKDFNRLSQSEPIQLQVWYWFVNDWNNVVFTFRVPNNLGWFDNTWALINWMLSSEDDTLIAYESYINYEDLWSSWNLSSWNIFNKEWRKLDGSTEYFKSFYDSNCSSGKSCILRITVVNDLILSNWNQIPFLEYKIDFNSNNVPLRYTRINSKWKSYSYTRSLEVRVPQQTINQAFDFAVFQ